MDDKQIIELYCSRSETAISETAVKYGNYCHTIAYNILHSREDSEECVNDTYFRVWNAIPPERPNKLSVFLGRITRNLSLDRFEKSTAAKRGGGQLPLALEELGECVSTGHPEEQAVDALVLSQALNQFLEALGPEQRKIFLRRYWYFSSIREIARDFHLSESKVKMTLMRARNQLRQHLEQEGIYL